MADETSTTTQADLPSAQAETTVTDTTTAPVDGADLTTASQPTNANGHAPAGDVQNEQETANTSAAEQVGDPANAPSEGVAEATEGHVEGVADATPLSGKKDKKKTAAVPEHKSKKLQKKKSMPTLHLDCKPGQHYWARLKGYPPWPAIICDEAMLPESLLASRPVSTARPDGSLRDDFKEGGKNAKERTYPIMFLATNEFAWLVNTALSPLDPEECKGPPGSKQTKILQTAYELASQNHDIHYYKEVLKQWQEDEKAIEEEHRQLVLEEERQAAEELAAKQAAKADEDSKKKKKSRKSKGGDDDVDLDGVEAPKSSKKRKKGDETDVEEPLKPKKTPKVKLNAPKTPNGESAKKSTQKPKKKIVTKPETSDEEKPQMTEEERSAQREKTILYLRHRLQKGFLSREEAPKEAEMGAMNDFFAQLETHEQLEAQIIRNTKIHKVLKAIVKLSSIPKEEEYNFKKRSTHMLEIWNKRMEGDGDVPVTSAAEPKSATEESTPAKLPETNGASKAEGEGGSKDSNADVQDGADEHVEAKAEEASDQIDNKMTDEPVKPSAPVPDAEETAAEKDGGGDAKDVDGDVSMVTAPETTEVEA